jgi:hypothetical protein
MAEPTGTARQEAEKLVATVLAMASQAGLGGPPKDRDPRDPAGLTGLTDMVSGFFDQFLGGNPPADRDERADPQDRGEQPKPAGSSGAGPAGSAESGGFDWREAYQHTLDSLGAQARQAAGRQLWAGATRFGGWSTGSAECCVCPICRAIAGVRNPTPEQAERLATGAGDFASGVASLLRAFSTVTGTTGTSTHRKPPPRPTTTPDQAWSTATRRAKPADTAPPDHEVRETNDPWTAATRAPRPGPAARATAPEDPTVGTAAEQAATQTDATGPETAPSEPAASPSSRSGDPWAAATRTSQPPTRPRTAPAPTSRPARKNPDAASAEADAWVVTPGGSVSHPAPGAESADQEPHRKAEPAQGAATRSPRRAGQAAPGRPSTEAAPTAAAQPTTDRSAGTHAAPVQDPAAAVDQASARTGKRPQETGTPTPSGPPPLPDNGPGSPRRVTGATDVWAAVTAANGDTAGDTGVAHTPSVDHDVPGTAPAAEAAEGRGAGSGDDARPGDAV